jgi:hypothetical protein
VHAQGSKALSTLNPISTQQFSAVEGTTAILENFHRTVNLSLTTPPTFWISLPGNLQFIERNRTIA